MPRLRLSFALTIAFAVLAPAGSLLAADICTQLEARLASLPRVSDTASARKYSAAITRQNMELRKAKSGMRQLGCSSRSVTVFGGVNREQCGRLATAVDKMERNLQVLDKKRREFAMAGGDRRARNRIAAALDANGCNDANRNILPAATDERMRTIEIDRPARLRIDRFGGDTITRMPPRHGGSDIGGLRTVCVRTCDGGFFPLTAGATPRDFSRDQKVCAMMCPDTETELYYHAIASQETEEMVSTVTGQPYALMPKAFAYRTRDLSKPAQCGCNLSAYYDEMLKRQRSLQGDATATTDADTAQTGSVTHITTKPAEKAADPEPRAIVERDYDPAKNPVRTIGPAFLPPADTAIDLRGTGTSAVN